MELSRKPATSKGPAETFTGDVWIDPITRGLPPSQLNVAAVRFPPGARTAWHSHDGGQTLYVTEGRGLVQARGQQIVERRRRLRARRRRTLARRQARSLHDAPVHHRRLTSLATARHRCRVPGPAPARGMRLTK